MVQTVRIMSRGTKYKLGSLNGSSMVFFVPLMRIEGPTIWNLHQLAITTIAVDSYRDYICQHSYKDYEY